MNNGQLYIVSTPIGNLEDITFRAISTLNEVDIIACEDTRVTQKLLNRYNISTKLISYHKFSEKQKSQTILQYLKEGKNIALVSDAGTPLISDPGSELIKTAKENQIKVVPIPGVSAVITALSAVENPDSIFVFLGFLPKSKNEKEEILSKYSEITAVFYESPNRLVKSLLEIKEILGSIKVTVARELTKFYEEIKTGTVDEITDYYSQHPPKGEIVVILEGKKAEASFDEKEIINKINLLKKEGFSTKEISRILSVLTDYSKNNIYEIASK